MLSCPSHTVEHWALSFTYPLSPLWKPICCDKSIKRYGTTVFLANRFNFPFIQRDLLRCPRWTEDEVDRKLSVRNEITKGILFNDVYWTGENKRYLCRENQIIPPIPWSRMDAIKWLYNTEIYAHHSAHHETNGNKNCIKEYC